jgi:hypothetical protein
MTDTEVATILARLDQFESRFDRIEAEIGSMRTSFEARFARIEAKLDEKPGYAALYQVTFGTVFALVAFTAAISGLFKVTGIIP